MRDVQLDTLHDENEDTMNSQDLERVVDILIKLDYKPNCIEVTEEMKDLHANGLINFMCFE